MLSRRLVTVVAVVSVLSAACGGGPRASSADLVSIRQPTPDPTLDAVVRDLPRALAGVVQPTPTLTPTIVVAVPKPKPAATPTPVPRPTLRPVTVPSPKPRL
jgi:hypothetical protein